MEYNSIVVQRPVKVVDFKLGVKSGCETSLSYLMIVLVNEMIRDDLSTCGTNRLSKLGIK